jgi:NADH:ubiquinone oxidoreductase subunit C
MDSISLKQYISEFSPEILPVEGKQYAEILIPESTYHQFCQWLKTNPVLSFDYLISLTAVDWNDHFMIVCHLTSTSFRHTVVVKTRVDRQVPLADTVSDLWKTAEYHECEVFDLFGITFRNHPDLRRLFLENDYGFPLRKDFVDDNRMIVR